MDNEKNEDILQLVSFRIEEEEFGVDINKVQEIIKMVEITSIPNSPEFIDGVVNLRGRIIPVIDLRVRLKFNKKESDNKSRIVVIEVESKTVGFLVDEVSEVLRVPQSITEKPPKMVAGIESGFIKAICKLENRLLILLDMEAILSVEEISEIDAVA